MHFVKNSVLWLILFIFVLLVNLPVISFDMIYLEQPTIYAANQLLHSWHDLFNVYFFPKFLDNAIPFFRPTGHFLIYQLMTPYVGWLNNKVFIIVNLFFLTCAGVYLIKLYGLLFPGMKTGGFIAFGIYLMHPALILSRFIVLHFEFMYVFFTVMSLYYFVLFWQANCKTIMIKGAPLQQAKRLVASLLFYLIACTCKEGAVVLGPVLISYLLISSYQVGFLNMRQVRQVILLIALLTLTMLIYLTLPWAGFLHPDKSHFNLAVMFFRDMQLLSYFFSLKEITAPGINIWGSVASPLVTRLLLWILSLICLVSFFMVRRHNEFYNKSLLFLLCATGIFLILPLIWGMGMPWHLSLALLTFSMILGFGFDYVCACLLPKQPSLVAVVGMLTAMGIGLSTLSVNQVNIQLKMSQIGTYLSLTKNAISHPPPIKNLLNDNSVIVVADHLLKNDYEIGNSHYPLLYVGQFDYSRLIRLNHLNLVQIQPSYNGKLFQLAYLMPTLREEEVPFQIDKMDAVPDQILYAWLRQYPNIFCFDYDTKGRWYDRTADFKQQLMVEKSRRQMRIGQYKTLQKTVISGKLIHVANLPFADAELCQEMCDQDGVCAGFNYVDVESPNQYIMNCHFYAKPISNNTLPCPNCTGFIKLTSST